MDQQIVYFIVYSLIAYFIGAITLVTFLILRHRGKIRVNILTPIGTHVRWSKPIFEGNNIYVFIRHEKRRKNIPEWKARITQIHDFPRRFGRRGREIYIMPEAPETITFDFERREIDQPMWDKKTSQEFINAKVLKREGEGMKPPIPNWILYITLIFVMISTLLGILTYLKIRGI